jgi:hypothetical protein
MKMDHREIGWVGVDWVDLAEDRKWWKALLNMVMNLRLHKWWKVLHYLHN